MKGKKSQLAGRVWAETPRVFALEELARMAETSVEVVQQYSEMGLLELLWP